MSSPYLNELIKIAKTDLPQLAHDLENASTIYTVQEAAKRLHNIVTYILHHIIMSDPSVAAAAAASATAAARAQPTLAPPPPGYAYARAQNGQIFLVPTGGPAPTPVGQTPAINHFPSLNPAIPPPTAHGLPLAGLMPPADVQSVGARVAEVVITARGSHVTMPTGETMVLPPGVAIDTTGGNNLPGIPDVHDYHANQPNPVTARPQFTTPDIVLPEGGGMTPEVAAALARRSSDPPMMDASGGARNITE